MVDMADPHRAEISGSGEAPFARTLNTTIHVVLQRDSVCQVLREDLSPLVFSAFSAAKKSVDPCRILSAAFREQ